MAGEGFQGGVFSVINYVVRMSASREARTYLFYRDLRQVLTNRKQFPSPVFGQQ